LIPASFSCFEISHRERVTCNPRFSFSFNHNSVSSICPHPQISPQARIVQIQSSASSSVTAIIRSRTTMSATFHDSVSVQTGQPWFSEELKTEFESLRYPLYFMDFETVNPPIPRFHGMRPYDHLPFQWSVHLQTRPSAAPEHFEFLAMDSGDPRTAFISSLCEALGRQGSIVVYNEQFESQRLWELAGWRPEYTQRIRAIQRRLWDLLPVVRKHVYHPAFAGSFSLKAVLPALVTDMSYEGLEVANGKAAGLAWESMIRANASEAERQAKRNAVLAYCGQDTLALVKLLGALQVAAGNKT